MVREFNCALCRDSAANEMINKICDSGTKVPTRELHTGCRCIRTEMAWKILSLQITSRSDRPMDSNKEEKVRPPGVNERSTSRTRNGITAFSKALSPVISHATSVTRVHVRQTTPTWQSQKMITLQSTIFRRWRIFFPKPLLLVKHPLRALKRFTDRYLLSLIFNEIHIR